MENLKINSEFLEKVLDHCKEIYNEEERRSETLNKTVRLYLAAMGFVFGVVILKLTTIKEISALVQKTSPSDDSVYEVVLISTFIVSVLLFFCSFIYTIMAVKMWNREQLCSSDVFIKNADAFGTLDELVSSIVANYSVASSRNHSINDKKAKYLSKALFSMITSFSLFFFAYSLLVIRGGYA